MTYRRGVLAAAGGIVAVLVFAAVAIAANAHFKSEPRFTDQGMSLNSTGNLVGLGNGDVKVSITPQGSSTVVCTTPSGSNNPPGQRPGDAGGTGTQNIPAEQVKNGNVAFNVSSTPPPSTVAGAPDCPNSKWTETRTDVSFTGAVLQVQQQQVEGGPFVTVLTATCTFSSPTTDGTVDPADVTCVSS